MMRLTAGNNPEKNRVMILATIKLTINPTRPGHERSSEDVNLVHRQLIRYITLISLGFFLCISFASAVDFKASSPAVTQLKQNIKQRHGQLIPFYDSGAVGLTRDGLIVLRDASVVPLSGRQSVNTLVTAENQDRNALYREIALANNHPEWESNIRSTFAQRWIKWAKPGWWYQQENGSWQKK